jgi:AcrR family transcriptional regulator
MKTHPEGPPKRRRNPEASRAAILEAARAVFTERGYARGTIREIAQRAGVTHGLVMRHFGSKERLIIAALPGPRVLAAVVPGDPATLPERIAEAFMRETESAGSEPAAVALIRSAASGEAVAMPLYAAMQNEIIETFRPALGPGSEVYAVLLSSLFIGVIFGRHVARTGMLAELTRDELQAYLVPAIRRGGSALTAQALAATGPAGPRWAVHQPRASSTSQAICPISAPASVNRRCRRSRCRRSTRTRWPYRSPEKPSRCASSSRTPARP